MRHNENIHSIMYAQKLFLILKNQHQRHLASWFLVR